MNRRDFVGALWLGSANFFRCMFSTGRGLVEATSTRFGGTKSREANPQKLFPADLPQLDWSEFSAAGFSEPVCGVIYRDSKPPCCGVPLGGLGTGCLDIEATGVLGFNALFDALPRKPQLLEPFLGLAVGDEVWVLTNELVRGGGRFQSCRELRDQPGVWRVHWPLIKGVRAAKEIHYWGHFPVADLEYETNAPVSVGLRAWAPFLPGDAATSNTPGAIFEVHLRNTTSRPQPGTLAFSFPGPTQQEAQVAAKMPTEAFEIGGRTASRPFVPGGVEGRHERIQKPVNGVSVVVETGVSYCLGVIDDESNMGRASAPAAL